MSQHHQRSSDRKERPVDQAFDVEWRRSFAVRQLFKENREVAFEVFKEVWNTAVDECQCEARIASQQAADRVGALRA